MNHEPEVPGAWWLECVDTFDGYAPYGRQGPFETRDQADAAAEIRRAEIQANQPHAGAIQDRVMVYRTIFQDGIPEMRGYFGLFGRRGIR